MRMKLIANITWNEGEAAPDKFICYGKRGLDGSYLLFNFHFIKQKFEEWVDPCDFIVKPMNCYFAVGLFRRTPSYSKKPFIFWHRAWIPIR